MRYQWTIIFDVCVESTIDGTHYEYESLDKTYGENVLNVYDGEALVASFERRTLIGIYRGDPVNNEGPREE